MAPPRKFSRYTGSSAHTITDYKRGPVRYIAPPDPINFRSLPGIRSLSALGGETWYQMAARAFPFLPRGGAELVRLLMEFQPEPAVDATIPLEAGQEVLVPPREYVEQLVVGTSAETRRIVGI